MREFLDEHNGENIKIIAKVSPAGIPSAFEPHRYPRAGDAKAVSLTGKAIVEQSSPEGKAFCNQQSCKSCCG